jgi:hypothetical protein
MKKLFTSTVSSFLVFIFFTSLIFPQQQPEYEIFRIGGLYWVSRAINDKPEVVGYDINLPSEAHLPFIWNNGQLTYLSNSGRANAFDINNNSQITGNMLMDPGVLTKYWPVIWNSINSYEIIGLPGEFVGAPNAINDNGAIAGTIYWNTYDSLRRGFVYDNGLYIIEEPTGCFSGISDINNDGLAVGTQICEDTIVSAFTLQSGVKTTYGSQFVFNAVNNSNHIAGTGRSYPYRAVKLINNIPYYVNNGIYTSSGTYSINDSSIMAGWASLYGIGSRAVIFENEQIIDLNNFVPPDSNIILTEARDINNHGDVLVRGYYPPNTSELFYWLLKVPRVEITHPAKGELLISGTKDSVMWTGGKANQNVDIEYSTDGGNSWRLDLIAENIPADTGKWHWEVPENIYSRKSLIRIYDHSTYETVIESDTFKIKPLILTKLDADSEYVSYNFTNDRFGFGNVDDKVWPQWYYSRFNYAGIDPVTGYIYDPLEYGYVFSLANASDFPDWGSFVSTFSVAACYHSTVPPVVYSLTALERWEAKKRNWGGSCFGIAAANGLIFERKNQFLNKFPDVSYFENPINLTTPDTGDIAAITTLFNHQFGNPTRANDNISYNIKTPNQTLSEIIEMLKEDEVKIKTLTIYNNNGPGAHTILAYQVKRHKDFPDLFYVYVYDNSYPNVNDGFILVDTAANSGNGDWGVSYAWNNWGGTKNIYLEIPDSNYLKPATLSKATLIQSPFIIKQNELEINNTKDASILIKDNSNNITGYQNNQVFSNIPGSRPLFIKNGSEDPPYGYYLQTDNYEIEMKDFTVTNPSIYLFTNNKSFSVKRDNAAVTQTDKFKYWMEQKLEISNPDNEPKTYQFTEIINESVKEKMYILRNVDMNQNDLFEMKSIDEDKLKITNYGSQKNYEIELQAVSAAGFGRFLNSSVNLSVTSNHTILPDWTDVTNNLLMILVDIGNNGTIDDTLFIENEVTGIGENQGLLIPTEYRLEQNYPNPFNPSTVIGYQLSVNSYITLTVYDVLGKEVAVLVNEERPAGRYVVEFNTSSHSGNVRNLPSGVYFYQLKAGDFIQTRKMILLK